MWGNSIATRVKKVIAERVKTAQKEHDEHCTYVDQAAESAISDIRIDAAVSKENHAHSMVHKIIGTN